MSRLDDCTNSIRCCRAPGQLRNGSLKSWMNQRKSTLVNLLLRFYELSPTGGDILIDGRSIRSLSKHAIRNATGFVTQESFLFNGTIRENLLFGKPDATETEIWEALRAANASEFVSRLPDGLDAGVGE